MVAHDFHLPEGSVRLSPRDRAARGKEARKAVPRSANAVYAPADDRPDPIDLLESQATTRVPDLVPIRYGRMLSSPFAFYRGAALIMASDLDRSPVSGLAVQACGDAHLSNFGAFGSPERSLVFDINDFDETNPGPWEWDLKRLVASFEIAARDREFDDDVRGRALLAVGQTYREAMARFAAMSNLDVWYARISISEFMASVRATGDKKVIRNTTRNVARAMTRDSHQALAKLTDLVDGRRQFKSAPPLLVPIAEIQSGFGDTQDIAQEIGHTLGRYRRTLNSDRRHLLEEFEYVDLARKVVGVGSVGTRAWVVLMQGRDGDDPLFLQAKEAQPSVLEAFTGVSAYDNHGERVVAGQRLMQSASDIFLGWDTLLGFDGVTRDFYIRQLRDWKASADIATIRPAAFVAYAQMCAWTLAKAHARSGDRIAISTYLGASDAMDRALAAFAGAYADQNERDHAALKAAVDSGRIQAVTGV